MNLRSWEHGKAWRSSPQICGHWTLIQDFLFSPNEAVGFYLAVIVVNRAWRGCVLSDKHASTAKQDTLDEGLLTKAGVNEAAGWTHVGHGGILEIHHTPLPSKH